MNEHERHNLFSELLARNQTELYAYIVAIVRNWTDADDLYQAVCVVLWRKFDSFQANSDFFAWARQTAKFEVRKFLTRRESFSHASEDLLDALAVTVSEARGNKGERHLAALERCRGKLDDADAELIDLHYVEDFGSREIADHLGRSQASICHSLRRIRRRLFECIQTELARQEHPDAGGI